MASRQAHSISDSEEDDTFNLPPPLSMRFQQNSLQSSSLNNETFIPLANTIDVKVQSSSTYPAIAFNSLSTTSSLDTKADHNHHVLHKVLDSEADDYGELDLPPPLSARFSAESKSCSTSLEQDRVPINPPTVAINSSSTIGKPETNSQPSSSRPTTCIPGQSSARTTSSGRGRRKASSDDARQEAQQAKVAKKLQAELKKVNKPAEALKRLVIRLDITLIQNKQFGSQLLRGLQELEGLQIDLCTLPSDQNTTGSSAGVLLQPPPQGVIWLQKLTSVDEAGGHLVTHLSNQPEEEVLLILSGKDFVRMCLMEPHRDRRRNGSDENSVPGGRKKAVRKSWPTMSFTQFVASFPHTRSYIIIIFEINKHVSKPAPGVPPPVVVDPATKQKLSLEELEEVLLDLHMEHNIHPRLCERPDDLVSIVTSYTKAISQKFHKQDRLDSLFTFLDTVHSAGVRLNLRYLEEKNGNGSVAPPASTSTAITIGGMGDKFGSYGGVQNLWRQQLLQWPGVTQEMTDAVLAVYPTYRSLYLACIQAQQRGDAHPERMFENIEIRRGAGVLASTRRLGKEFSRRLYEYMTVTDSSYLIE